eukprot:Blabericola_migrator_1__1794@NODE_1486_length_4441_cov_149_315501_g296_i1_p2_GENE_NODE_1486_length_4441_cov_149_315501_g296_i1NODE_1486_length_4441_cov_149_315501_g296_i1_p2_ORF_typecomplete_len423_score30_94MFS_1/PF07690_16/1_7e08MFS_1/PF07690_16/9_4e14MFS_3/PF05977_13/1_4e08MFS_2/PF13347_6/1_2e02MFS_2/PF13347_6/4_9e07Sugar_tr/PF00083_24/2_2e03Sugar_tr/PF00083_24/2_8e05MFS_4/PF06779_14/0_00043_NODE_1486_length_4441_cov_149_315501_g296_i15191787
MRQLYVARGACVMLFLTLGMNIGCWVSAMPGLKKGFNLDAGQLGLAIMCSGLASLGMAIPAGRLVDNMGCRVMSFSSGVFGPIAYGSLPMLAKFGVSPYIPLFMLNVISAGGYISCNARASELEAIWGKPIMSSFHAAFSAGGLIGAASYSFLLSHGLDWDRAYPITNVITMTMAFLIVPFMDIGMKQIRLQMHLQRPSTAELACAWSPSPIILMLGCVASVAMLNEGAVGDWFALYLQDYDKCPYAYAPLGYACFAAFMGFFRAVGDIFCRRYGRRQVYAASTVLVFAGLTGFLSTKSTLYAMAFCMLLGTGCANIVPILISVASKHAPSNPGVCIATVSSFGNAGLLTGPAVIGFIAQFHGLRVGLCLLPIGAVFLMLASVLVNDKIDQRRRSYTEAFHPDGQNLMSEILDYYEEQPAEV